MFANLAIAIVATSIMATYGDQKPAQYPANVSPADCVNYPFCGPSPNEGGPTFKAAEGGNSGEKQTGYTATASKQYVQTNAVQAGANYLPYVYLTLPSQQAQFYSAGALPAQQAQYYSAIPIQAQQQAQYYSAASLPAQQYYYTTYSAPAVAAAQPVAPQPAPAPAAAAAAAAPIEAPKFRKVDLPIEYPAGVSPAACPNYPYCNTNIQYARFKYEPVGAGYAAGNSGEATGAIPAGDKYPANFDSTKCIDYPFCTQNA